MYYLLYKTITSLLLLLVLTGITLVYTNTANAASTTIVKSLRNGNNCTEGRSRVRTNWGFNIPAGHVITGVSFRLRYHYSGNPAFNAQLIVNNTAQGETRRLPQSGTGSCGGTRSQTVGGSIRHMGISFNASAGQCH